MTAKENIEIFNDTLEQIQNKYQVSMDNIEVYAGLPEIEFVGAKRPPKSTPVECIHGGTVSTGYRLAKDMKVAILNFADALECGGLVLQGANTQEENICRCSNLYGVLTNHLARQQYYEKNQEEVARTCREIYTDRIIYGKGITVFKDDMDYTPIEPRKLDVITCPAPNTYLDDGEAIAIYVRRIKQILLSAIENKVECIVLGAWGCGDFGQDPEFIAVSFAYALQKYGHFFKRIVFAFRTTTQSRLEPDMYDIFSDTLKNFYQGGTIDEK